MSKAELQLAPGITEVIDLDRWAMPLLEDLAVTELDKEVLELIGQLAIKLDLGIELQNA